MNGPGGHLLAQPGAALADSLDLDTTPHARSEDRGDALSSGDQRHPAKPIGPTPLVAAIVALVREGIRA